MSSQESNAQLINNFDPPKQEKSFLSYFEVSFGGLMDHLLNLFVGGSLSFKFPTNVNSFSNTLLKAIYLKKMVIMSSVLTLKGV